MHRTRSSLALLLPLAATLLVGCHHESDSGGGSVTVYSGRNESLIGPLLTSFEEATGIEVQVRYAGTSELAATLMEEGEHTRADVFISQDAVALGSLSAAGLLRPLPEAVLERIPARFASPEGDWVGLSGRARTVVYNTERVAVEDLPQRLQDVADPRYRGRFGVAPTNGSLQAHLAAYAAAEGLDALDDLLSGMEANEPRRYPKNSAIVRGVLAGEVDWGLVNHYYLWRVIDEDPEAPGANYFMPGGGSSGFVNLAGAALLSDSPEAERLVDWMLSDEAQRYFAEETFEYPLVAGVPAAVALPPLDELAVAEVDFAQVSEAYEPTLSAIRSSGLIE